MHPKSHLGAKLRCTELSFAELTLKETFRSPQEAPESPQEAPRGSQEAPKRPPRGSQEAPKRAPKSVFKISPFWHPKWDPKRSPRGPQRAPKRDPKSRPKRTKIDDNFEHRKSSPPRPSWGRLGAILGRFQCPLGEQQAFQNQWFYNCFVKNHF